jgi:hypothetical protein
MEQGNKLNMKLPYFSVNDKGTVAINNAWQLKQTALSS